MTISPAPIPEAPAPANGHVVPVEQVEDALSSVRRHWLLVLAVTGCVMATAFLVTHLMTKGYDATSRVLLTNTEPVDVIQQTATHSLDPERDLNTGVNLVSVRGVSEPVRKELGLSTSVTALERQVHAALEGTTNVLAITVRDANPVRAAAIANAFARQYVTFRRDSAAAQYQEAASLARERLRTLPASQSATRTDVRHRLHELQTAASLQTGGVQLLDPAEAPSAPATPRMSLNLIVALIAGLGLGSLIAVVLGRRRPFFRPADMKRALDSASWQGTAQER